MYPGASVFHRAKYNEVRLAADQVQDAHDLYTRHPILRSGRNALLTMVLRCRPKVQLNPLPHVLTKELEMLMDMRYRAAAENVYDWLKQYGVWSA